MKLKRRVQIFGLVTFFLAACSQLQATDPEQLDLSTLNVDEQFVSVAQSSPGFAGLHYADDGALIVNAAPESGLSAQAKSDFTVTEKRKTKLVDEVVARFGPEILTHGYASRDKKEKFKLSLGQLKKTVKVQAVAYDYDTLNTWFTATLDLLAHDGVVSHDLDEVENRIVFGVDDPGVAAEVKGELERLGVPQGAAHFKQAVLLSKGFEGRKGESSAPQLQAQALTVQSQHSVIRGGIQFESIDSLCTIGLVVRRNGVRGFVTNAHCTPGYGSVATGVRSYMYQAEVPFDIPFNGIGKETVDPAFRRTSRCPSGMLCRLSDSAFFESFKNRSAALGEIVETRSGSLSVENYRPLRREVARSSIYANLVVHKTGRTSGTTSGKVTSTCTNFKLNEREAVECDVQTTLRMEGGDSGAPVWRRAVTSCSDPSSPCLGIAYDLIGLGYSRFGHVSPISDIEAELGRLDNIAD